MAETFGPYRLVSLLGAGGMGEVWRAHDVVKDREVALKLLGAWLGADPAYVRRFRREAALAARLNAPNIIPIHDYGEIDRRLFIDMPLIDGVDLDVLLVRDGPLPPARAVDIVDQVADALDTAHRAGLLHRDVKPSNVLVTGRRNRDFVYLIDFGIAASAGSTTLTAGTAGAGTPAYMAPERFSGEGDQRSDVYALACILHAALTGHSPFVAPSDAYSLGFYVDAHLNRAPPRPSVSRPGVPEAFDAVVARGMAKNPSDRYPSAGDLAAAAQHALAAAGHDAPAVDVTHPSPTRSATPPPPTTVPAAAGAPPDPTVTPPRPVRRRKVLLAAAGLIGGTALAAWVALSGSPVGSPSTASPTSTVRPDVDQPDPRLANAGVVNTVRAGVFKVRARKPQCGRQTTGSGFVVAPELVMTSAYVVAGPTTSLTVEVVGTDNSVTPRVARVVSFDSDRDVAVLRVPGLSGSPLRFYYLSASPGDNAVILGYPQDGPYTAVAARVRQRINLAGQDIYDRGHTQRDVYSLRAVIRSGSAGGPVLRSDGSVLGMIVGSAGDSSETAFALTGLQLISVVRDAAQLTAPVPTGACTN